MTKQEKIRVLENTLRQARLLLWREGDEGQILPLPPEYYEPDTLELIPNYKGNLHPYTSTACGHGLHDKCRLTCKFCTSPCMCNCHSPNIPGTDRLCMECMRRQPGPHFKLCSKYDPSNPEYPNL